MMSAQCPKCKMPAEEVAPTSVWEHLVPDNVELHEYECFRCHITWVVEKEKQTPLAPTLPTRHSKGERL